MAQTLKHLPGMRETQVQSLGWEDPLQKEMATHSSTLAWRIPWREEPGRLQSMGLQRVGHNWATSLHLTKGLVLAASFWKVSIGPAYRNGSFCYMRTFNHVTQSVLTTSCMQWGRWSLGHMVSAWPLEGQGTNRVTGVVCHVYITDFP